MARKEALVFVFLCLIIVASVAARTIPEANVKLGPVALQMRSLGAACGIAKRSSHSHHTAAWIIQDTRCTTMGYAGFE
ncbi:hypothetical protein HN51_022388 [Arachis hypogaea]